MKAKSIIIAAVAMMAIVPTASAQEQIKKAFQEITDELAGVTKVGEHNTAKVDANGIAIESKVITIKVERRYQHSVSETLKDAFRNEASKTSMFEEETGNEKLELDSALVHDLGLRRMWSIWRDDDDAVLIGSMKNSTYYIANFNDKKHKGYRTCYAAEWSNADNPEVYTAKLVYVYGRKPQNETSQTHYFGTATFNPHGTVTLHSNIPYPNLPTNLREQLQGLRNLPDSLFTVRVDRLDDFENGFFGNGKPQDIPLDGDLNEWMAKATNNVSHLSNSDWHRFFGLMTQKMIDRANKESAEDLVVAAGIVLNLCKNANQLDADEREVSARRLEDVAEHYFTSDKHQYIYDLLMLGAKKLQKK